MLFRENDPFHFLNLHTAMLSLFRAATYEDWTDIMCEPPKTNIGGESTSPIYVSGAPGAEDEQTNRWVRNS